MEMEHREGIMTEPKKVYLSSVTIRFDPKETLKSALAGIPLMSVVHIEEYTAQQVKGSIAYNMGSEFDAKEFSREIGKAITALPQVSSCSVGDPVEIVGAIVPPESS